MAIPRKRALARVQAYAVLVEQHLTKIVSNPGHSSVPHWKREIRNWLQLIEEMISHVGKKTAAEWQPRLQAYKESLEKS